MRFFFTILAIGLAPALALATPLSISTDPQPLDGFVVRRDNTPISARAEPSSSWRRVAVIHGTGNVFYYLWQTGCEGYFRDVQPNFQVAQDIAVGVFGDIETFVGRSLPQTTLVSNLVFSDTVTNTLYAVATDLSVVALDNLVTFLSLQPEVPGYGIADQVIVAGITSLLGSEEDRLSYVLALANPTDVWAPPQVAQQLIEMAFSVAARNMA